MLWKLIRIPTITNGKKQAETRRLHSIRYSAQLKNQTGLASSGLASEGNSGTARGVADQTSKRHGASLREAETFTHQTANLLIRQSLIMPVLILSTSSGLETCWFYGFGFPLAFKSEPWHDKKQAEGLSQHSPGHRPGFVTSNNQAG